MPTITSSEFGAPLQNLLLGPNMRISAAERIQPGTVQRSGAPNPGLGACWGWTPAGEVSLNCRKFYDSVNKKDAEFLFDCIAFTTPSTGYLRFYATPLGVPNIQMPLVVIPDVAPSLSNQVYHLSQVFELGQTADVYPGATEFNAAFGTIWLVNQFPIGFLWSPSAAPPLKITPATISITYQLGPRLTQASWTIAL